MMWVWAIVLLMVGATLGFLAAAILHAAAGADLAADLKRHRLRLEVGRAVLLDSDLAGLLAVVGWAADDGRLELANLCPEPDTVVALYLDQFPKGGDEWKL